VMVGVEEVVEVTAEEGMTRMVMVGVEEVVEVTAEEGMTRMVMVGVEQVVEVTAEEGMTRMVVAEEAVEVTAEEGMTPMVMEEEDEAVIIEMMMGKVDVEEVDSIDEIEITVKVEVTIMAMEEIVAVDAEEDSGGEMVEIPIEKAEMMAVKAKLQKKSLSLMYHLKTWKEKKPSMKGKKYTEDVESILTSLMTYSLR